MASGDPAAGSVAEEAARLIGLLCGDPSGEAAWAAGARAAARSGPCPTCGRDPSPGVPGSGVPGSDGAGSGAAPPGAAGSGAAALGATRPDASAPPDPVCRYCPVCSLVGLLRSISPEVIDRIADAVDLVSGGLRDLADVRRGNTATPPAPAGPADSPQ